MSMIDGIKTYLLTYTGLSSGAPVWVNHLEPNPVSYSIAPLPGQIVVEEYINGSSLRQYNFAFLSTQSTAAELSRFENNEFFEQFATWLESQSEAGVLPSLDAGQTATKIEATGWGYLYQEGESDTGIYQIQCLLTYLQL